MNTNYSPSVKIQLPCDLQPISTDENTVGKIKNVEIAFKSDVMQNYENGTLFSSKTALKSVHFQNQLLNFSIGTDGELYMIQQDEEGKNYWNYTTVCHNLISEVQKNNQLNKPEVLSFNIATATDVDTSTAQLAALCCIGNQKDAKNHTIFVTTDLNVEKPEETHWITLGTIQELSIESVNLAQIQEDAENELEQFKFVCNGRKNTTGYLYSFYYNTLEEEWIEINFTQFDEIKDVQFGINPTKGLGAYAVGSYKEKNKFSFTPFDEATQLFQQSSTEIASYDFENPVAFILETINDPSHDYHGISEVYMIEKKADNKNEIKYLSAKEQDHKKVSENTGAITISGEFEGEAEKIFFNRNTEGRIDLYAHVLQGKTGKLLHTYLTNDDSKEIKRWCPIYILETDVSIVSPASNAEGRICEVFMVANDNTDLRYMWQDDKLFSWHREKVCVAALDHAIPVNSVQTKITFYNGDTKEPILFPALKESYVSITPLEAISLEINQKKYSLDKGETVKLSTKELMGEILMNINVSKADAPYFELKADFIPNEKIIIHPVEKIQNTMEKMNADDLKNPKDRYDNEVKNLVDKEDEKHIDVIVKAVNETAQFKPEKLAQYANASFTEEEKAALDREGVWVVPKEEVFDTKLNMEMLNGIANGPLFAIDFSGGVPVFLDREACLNQNIGISTLEPTYVGIWDDLAKHFGSFIEAIKNTADKVTMFVAEKVAKGIKLIVTIAGKAIECIVKFAEQVMSTILMMLEKFLKIALEKMLQWLGFVFDINYIRSIQKTFADRGNQSLAKIKEGVKDAKKHIQSFMDKLNRDLKDGALFTKILEQQQREKIVELLNTQNHEEIKKIFLSYGIQLQHTITIIEKETTKKWEVSDAKHTYIIYNDAVAVEIRIKIELPKNIQSQSPKNYKKEIHKEAEKNYNPGDKEKATEQEDILKNDPAMNWAMTQLKSIPSLGNMNILTIDVDAEIKETIKDFFEQTLTPLANENVEVIKDKIKKTLEFLKDTNNSIGDIFLYVTKNLLEFGFDLLDAIMKGLLKAVDALASAFISMLTSALNIPVLKELFKLVVGTDVPFNVINGASLLLAIPASIFCKLSGIQIPKSNLLNKTPEWIFYTDLYGFWILKVLQDGLTYLRMCYNWVQKIDPTGEIGKLGKIALTTLSVFARAPFLLILNSPVNTNNKPTSEQDKIINELTFISWFTELLESSFTVGHILLVAVLPNVGSEVIYIFRSILEGAIKFMLSTTLVILKTINFVNKEEWSKMIDNILWYLQSIDAVLSRIYRCVGDSFITSEPISAIVKSIFHGSVLFVNVRIFALQIPRVIIQTVEYNKLDANIETHQRPLLLY